MFDEPLEPFSKQIWRVRDRARLARKILPAIIAREYGGQHRDSPTDAARIAFEYAEAFQAEAKRRAAS